MSQFVSKWVNSLRAKTIFATLSFLGLVAFVISLNVDLSRAWHAYLVALFYFVSLSVGSLFFLAIQFVTRSRWSVNIRRYSEGMIAFLPMAFVLSIIFYFGAGTVYVWFDSELMHQDPLLEGKMSYLNPKAFALRLCLFFAIWIFFKNMLVGISIKEKGSAVYDKGIKWAVMFLLAFSLSYSLFSVDLLMSLEPRWYSTIFGVYAFSGMFQSALAMIILLVIHAMDKNWIPTSMVNDNHLHDLGKLLFGFTVFWAYIAFSQFMLIWYANIPDETSFFIARLKGPWVFISLSLLIFKFIVPFFMLLPRWAKRNRSYLKFVSVLILVMQYVDLYWIIYPNYSPEALTFSFPEVLIFFGFFGIFMIFTTKFLNTHTLIPKTDPYFDESCQHKVTY